MLPLLSSACAATLQLPRIPGVGQRLACALTTAAVPLPALAEAANKFEPRGITPEDTFVFLLGCVPFVSASSAA